MTLMAPTGTANDKTGNGQYTPLKRKKNNGKRSATEQMDLLDKKDIRMRFRNSKDPVYVAFEYLDKQPLQKLAIDFIKESFAEIAIFTQHFKKNNAYNKRNVV